MDEKPLLKLTRELRFGLHESDPRTPSDAANGFAGNPTLSALAPFLTLSATLSGETDPRTGMLINIKIVDLLLRQHAVPRLRRAYYETGEPVQSVIAALFVELREKFLPHTLECLTLGLSPYLFFSSEKEEPAMVRLTQRFEFSAAHRLHSQTLSDAENREIFGRCNNPNGHGHNYELEVCVRGTIDPLTGEVMSIELLQRLVNHHVLNVFDHKHLNVDCAEFHELNPTVENIAAVIWGKLRGAISDARGAVRLEKVRVWETPKTVCEVGE